MHFVIYFDITCHTCTVFSKLIYTKYVRFIIFTLFFKQMHVNYIHMCTLYQNLWKKLMLITYV